MEKENIKAKKQDNQEMSECCKPRNKGIKSGVLAGIIPHAGCIAIIVFALLGVTVANSFFIRFLSNKYYIPVVFSISLLIAGVSAFFYTRRFQNRRIMSHWKYLSILFASVIIINLFMIYFVFPVAAKLNNRQSEGYYSIKIDFTGLPCSGHIPLVISELEKVEGIKAVNYVSGDTFEIFYDSGLINKEDILEQNICRELKAKEK